MLERHRQPQALPAFQEVSVDLLCLLYFQILPFLRERGCHPSSLRQKHCVVGYQSPAEKQNHVVSGVPETQMLGS